MGGAATGGAASGGAASGGAPDGSAGDSAGSSASAGAGSTAACSSVTSGDVRAWLFHELPSVTTSELHPFLALTNSGNDIPLKQISIRYFFSAEGSGEIKLECLWVTQDGGSGHGLCDHGAAVAVVELEPAVAGADHYLEVSFPSVGNEVLSNLVPPVVDARVRLWRDGHPTLNQSNDYSFVPTTNRVLSVENKAYKQTTKVAVYRSGALIWGEEPCP